MRKREVPRVVLEADIYKNLPNVTKVLTVEEIEYYLWVHLPEDIARHFTIYQVDKFVDGVYELCNFSGFIDRDGLHPWISFLSGFLDKSVGQHIYRLSLVNTATHDICALYFSYIMQTENVDKPYVYMNNTCCD